MKNKKYNILLLIDIWRFGSLKMKETKKALRENKNIIHYLYVIIIMLILDPFVLYCLLKLDAYLCTPKAGQVGFPMPIIFMLGAVVLAAINFIVIVAMLFLAIRRYHENKKLG